MAVIKMYNCDKCGKRCGRNVMYINNLSWLCKDCYKKDKE